MRLLDKESDLKSKKKTRFCGTANPVNFHLLCIFSLYRCVNLLGARIPRKDIVKAINYIKYMKTHTKYTARRQVNFLLLSLLSTQVEKKISIFLSASHNMHNIRSKSYTQLYLDSKYSMPKM